MRRSILLIAAVLLLAACSSGKSAPTTDGKGPVTPASSTSDATGVFKALAAAVPTAKLTWTATAVNDPNHLLGRPGQYTSKIAFADSQIPSKDTELGGTQLYKAGDLQLGGSVEVFPSLEDAAARAKYVTAVTKSVQAFAEYDYQHGDVVLRLSHLLTPDQAAKYKAALGKLS
ncbi:lipoprotein [Streptomyces olivoreticuli]|uniref:lipoprotein n=1 Tax=Streptomyces olivoreticuli TaxID=68246 RepID=UPI000E27DB2E|nr:lipoprotein [Streptomyces olivoreticuli]